MAIQRNYTCQNEDCKKAFTTHRHGQRFCSPACKSMDAYHKKWKGKSKLDRAIERAAIKDSQRLLKFKATGSYVEGTEFTVDSENRLYWIVYCPECRTTNRSHHQCLENGSLPCECSPMRQKQGYINMVFDGEIPVALKYGIANNALLRFKSINSTSALSLFLLGVWEYETKDDCRRAESLCKKNFKPTISKADMPDGYTETCKLTDFEQIVRIYEEYGGINIYKQDMIWEETQ